MKKVVLLLIFISFIFISACSVQESMSADIFFNRLSKISSDFDFENSEQFIVNGKSCCFLKDINGAEYAFEITLNESGDAEKIAFSCRMMPESLIPCIQSVVKTYSPEDDAEEVISALFESGKPKQGNNYYETQWRNYSVYVTEGDFFFSVSSKKSVRQSYVELSLKPNDRVDF